MYVSAADMGEVDTQNYDELLDVSGLSCPLPVLKSKATLARMSVGSVLKVVATHPDSEIEIPALCRLPGLKLLELQKEAGVFTYWIQKTL